MQCSPLKSCDSDLSEIPLFLGATRPVRALRAGRRETAEECDSFPAEGTTDDLLSLTHYGGEVIGAFEAFRVEFVDILGPGRTGGEPTTHRNDFQATD
jgi:hypothetical protein